MQNLIKTILHAVVATLLWLPNGSADASSASPSYKLITSITDHTNSSYDGNKKRVKSTAGGSTIYNIYDASGSLVHIDDLTTNKKITYVDKLARVTQLGTTTPVTTYLHHDHLGSAVSGTLQSGTVNWTERYTPFGEKLLDPLANRDQASFTGHIDDQLTGLTYMQARYYEPVIGRFLSVDPVTFLSSGENPDYFNSYAYTFNDPVNNTDPDGEAAGTVGVEVQGSVFGYGGGASLKLAGSISKKEGGGFKLQVGFVGGIEIGATAPTLVSSASTSSKLGAIASGLLDTGLTAVVEVGGFTGTDANPADVEDLSGQGGQFGVAVPSKSVEKILGKTAKGAVNYATPAAISVNGVVGENGIKGVELGAGIGVGATVDITESTVTVLTSTN